MSVSLIFTVTQAGLTACFNASNTGLAVDLTHVQFGSGNRSPDGSETALVDPKQVTTIGSGFLVSPSQIRMSAIMGGGATYDVREVGIWSGTPGAIGSVLVMYYSMPVGFLAQKNAGIDFILSVDVVLNGSVPPGSLTILADTSQSAALALITAHEKWVLDEISKRDTIHCRFATPDNDALAGLTIRDGVTPAAGDLVLVNFQTTGADNGVYVAAAGAWTRWQYADSTDDLLPGQLVTVSEGHKYADSLWMLKTNEVITVGATNLTFIKLYPEDIVPDNVLINGGMDVWQRFINSIGVPLFGPVATPGYDLYSGYICDKWNHGVIKTKANLYYDRVFRVSPTSSIGVPTLAQSGNAFSFAQGVEVVSASASPIDSDMIVTLNQLVEGYLYAPIAGQDLVFSFWVYSSVVGAFCANVSNSGRPNPSTDYWWFPYSFDISQANTWELKVIRIQAPPQAGSGWHYDNSDYGIRVDFVLGCGSRFIDTSKANKWNRGDASNPFFSSSNSFITTANAIFAITGVSLATKYSQFKSRPFDEELRRCQRYYEKSYDYDVYPGNAVTSGSSSAACLSGHNAIAGAQFKVSKRVRPTVRIYRPSTGDRNDIESIGGVLRMDAANYVGCDAGTEGLGSIIYSQNFTVNETVRYHWIAEADLF